MVTKKLIVTSANPRDENNNIGICEDDADAKDSDDEEGTIIV